MSILGKLCFEVLSVEPMIINASFLGVNETLIGLDDFHGYLFLVLKF